MHKDIKKAMERVPLLPYNISALFRIINDPTKNFGDLTAIVSQDPALAMQTLHLCNSAYYSFPEEITSIHHAIMLMGMDTVAGLAMAAYLQELLEPKDVSGKYWLKGAKNHVLSTSRFAEYLASKIPVQESPRTAFTGGLLHDIGKLVLSRLPSEITRKVISCREKDNVSFLEAERIVLGEDHAEIGYYLAEKWEVPELIREIIRYHHAPTQSKYILTLIVYIANSVVNQLDNGRHGVIDLSGIDPEVIEELHMNKDDILMLLSDWDIKLCG